MAININGTLQEPTVLSGSPILIGKELGVAQYHYGSLHVFYTKGAETGLVLLLYNLTNVGGSKIQFNDWVQSSGSYIGTPDSWSSSASLTKSIPIDLRYSNAIRVEGYGSGSVVPTGTLGIYYSFKE